jgi:5-methylcytosine-specific restriction endonuclease McrA
MYRILPRHRRLRLEGESYKQLCREVLQRDGWKCQLCGGAENLQIHHQQFRSRSGNDSVENLITVCVCCHESLHHPEHTRE